MDLTHMESPRLRISDTLRSLMTYPKLAGERPRVLIPESQYWLDTACIHAARAMGWDVVHPPIAMVGHMPREMIARFLETLTAFRPDFILSINLGGMDEMGLFSALFADLEIPHVTWFVDDPRTILMGRTCYASPHAIALTWERAYVPSLEQAGFAEVHVMPLAVDDTIFNAPPAEAAHRPPAFVGNSMTDFAQREWIWIEERPALALAVRDALAAGRVTRERFGLGMQAVLENAGVLDTQELRHVELFCFIEGTRRLRMETVQALEPEGLMVFGDEAWRPHVAAGGGFVNYTGELPAFYRDCEVNLNITSIQMATAVNQRVFDCPAAGGFLLTDAQASLDELFDAPNETARYHSLEEARDLLRFYRAHPKARHDIVNRARTRILGEHTYRHRLMQILAILRSRYQP